jgi:hypothetical protein
MSGEGSTLEDIRQLLGTMNGRFDAIERQVVHVRDEVAGLKAHVSASVGALKESIDARDFRIDEYGRRLSELEARGDD